MNDELQNLKKPGGAVVVMLCVTAVLATLAFGAVEHWSIGLIGVLTAVIVLMWLRISWRTGAFSFSQSPLLLPFLGIIVIGFIQLLPFGNSGVSPDMLGVPASDALSLDPYATRFFLIRAIILFVFFAAALTFINSRERLARVATVLIIFGAAMAFFAILQRLANVETIYGLRGSVNAQPFGSYINQHHFAALMEMLSGVTLGLLFGHAVKRDKKLLLGIAALVIGIAVIFTGSRGGLISYLGVVGFAALGSFLLGRVHSRHGTEPEAAEKVQHKLVLIGGGLALLLLVVGSASFLGGGEGLFRGIGAGQAEADITGGRSHYWSIALQIFLANPILGAGLDAFGVAFTRYDTWHGLYRVEQAHNDYLQILADSGLLGFACVAAFIYLFIKRSSAAISGAHSDMGRSIAIGAAAGCLGILIHSFFDFPLRTTANAFFFFLLVVMATNVVGKSGGRHRRSSER